jgi:hypothetical protein
MSNLLFAAKKKQWKIEISHNFITTMVLHLGTR